MIAKLNTEAGAKGMAQMPIPFSESLQELEILEAYTLRPDGTRIDVKKESIFTQAAPVAISAPMFNDIKYRIIVYPEPVAGGKVAFTVSIKQKTPYFPGHFSAIEAMPTTVVHDDTEIRVSIPSDYPLKTDVRGFEGGVVETKAGRTFYKWTLRTTVARKPEPYEVAEVDFGPYVAVSSFENWAELGKAYLARVEDKIITSDSLRTQASEIVKGAKDRRDEVRMIYEWVTKNVRYVGVFLGLGGFEPRGIPQILETKYGDCKDHTTLMMALLRARGIDATTALVQIGSAFQLPKIPVVGAFNHAVTYVPEFNLYLDGTSEFTSWNVVPQAIAGKTTLLTGLGKLAGIPSLEVAREQASSAVKIAINADGTATGTTSVRTDGNAEAVLRAQLAAIPAGQEDKWVSSWIKRAGPQATAKLETSNPRDFSKPLKFQVSYSVKDAVAIESPGAFKIPRGLIHHPVAAIAGSAAQVGKRQNAFVCGTETRIETFEIALPENAAIAALPKPVSYTGKTVAFESTYRQEGNTIFATRKVTRNRPTAWCAPDLWDETEQLSAAIARDDRGQILLK
jgi:transglutaminase-like putative cysteine protease